MQLKLVFRMTEMDSYVEAARLGAEAEAESIARSRCYIAASASKYMMPAVLQQPHGRSHRLSHQPYASSARQGLGSNKFICQVP